MSSAHCPGCKSIWAPAAEIPVFTVVLLQETIDFDYCIIAAGCNFGPFHKPPGCAGRMPIQRPNYWQVLMMKTKVG
jgi:hypothetical protein